MRTLLRWLIIKFDKLSYKLFSKRLVYYTPNANNELGKTAVRSVFGFWYVGKVMARDDIAYGIMNNGVMEEEETKLTLNILNKLKFDKSQVVFYDVGANTGYYGIMAAYLGGGKVISYSFEPVKEYFDCMLESVRLNRMENRIKGFNVALGDANGVLPMYIIPGASSTFKKVLTYGREYPMRNVQVVLLDELMEKENILPPDFMVIDVDGHELNMLKGSKQLIGKFAPIIFIETIYNINGYRNFEYDLVLEFLQEKGYQILCFSKDRLVSVASPHEYYNGQMFLCLHKDRHNQFILEANKFHTIK